MGYNVMDAWSKGTFEFNDRIQSRGNSWKGEFSFDSEEGRSIINPDYIPPLSPAHTNSPKTTPHREPSFQDTTSRWSPPESPHVFQSTASMRASPEPLSSPRTQSPAKSPPSPRVDSASAVRAPSSPLSPKERYSLASNLYAAACAGDIQHMELLLALGAPIHLPTMVEGLYDSFKPPKSGALSALAGAAGCRQLPTVRFLLSRGAELNPDVKVSSSAPLHQACRADDCETATFLLDLGADVNALNCYRTTPLMYAVKHGSPPLVSTLLSHGADLHIRSFISTTAIHWAVWFGNAEILELLLRAGADPNQTIGDGSAPLHFAAMAEAGEARALVRALLTFGADPTQVNGEGKTPALIAEGNGDLETARVLVVAAAARASG